jgi:hypothetical protein
LVRSRSASAWIPSRRRRAAPKSIPLGHGRRPCAALTRGTETRRMAANLNSIRKERIL